MAYPVTPTDRTESKRTPVSTRQVDHSDSGKPWIREMGSVDYFEFDVFHPFITTAQKDAILAEWAANRNAVFDYLWPFDGVTYSVAFAGRPEEHAITATRWHVRTKLLSVA